MFAFTSHESAAVLPPNVKQMFAEYNQGYAVNSRRYEHLQRDHMAQSRLALRRAADAAVERAEPGSEREALLLGTGPCMDLPPVLERSILGLRGLIRASHIYDLTRTVDDRGVLHYADAYLSPDLPIIGSSVETALREYLTPVGESRQWNWQMKPGQEYTVVGGMYTLGGEQ